MNTLVFRCPQCQRPFQVLAEQVGLHVRCPGCEATVQIPESSPTASPSPTDGKLATLQSPPQQQKPKRKSKKSLKPNPTPKSNPDPSNQATLSPPKPSSNQDGAKDDIHDFTNSRSPDLVTPQPAAKEFAPQPVDHLLPPKFGAIDPAVFYRRHQDGTQVLLPTEDGTAQVVNNRIVTIQHDGKTYQLVSSPQYDRFQKSILTNVLALVICALVIAIVMTLLSG
jgi:DNA-directed RNA polymerase subunit RPC12/RpoP